MSLLLHPADWQRADDYAETFATPAGQRVAADLFGFCHLDGAHPVLDDGPIDPYRTHVRLGHLEVWLHIARQREIARERDRQYPEAARPRNAFGDPLTKEP